MLGVTWRHPAGVVPPVQVATRSGVVVQLHHASSLGDHAVADG